MTENTPRKQELTEQRIEFEKLELERFQAKLNFWKGIIVSGVVALVLGGTSTVLNYQISHREIELKREENKREAIMARQLAENEYLAKFVEEALGENLERRVRFAQYFATLTGEGDSRDRWQKYFEAVKGDFAALRKELEQKKREREIELSKENADKTALEGLDIEISTLQHQTIPVSQKNRPVLDKYWIVVGSHRKQEDAQKHVDRINAENDDIGAFVGIFNEKTGFYPVIAGYGTYTEAQVILKKATGLTSITDAYLSRAN